MNKCRESEHLNGNPKNGKRNKTTDIDIFLQSLLLLCLAIILRNTFECRTSVMHRPAFSFYCFAKKEEEEERKQMQQLTANINKYVSASEVANFNDE